MMDIETLNKAIVSRWFSSFWGSCGDLAVVDELADPDLLLQYSDHNPRRGHRAVKRFMTDFREAFPDLDFRRIGSLIADRDIVVVRWEARGTHTGPAFDDFHIGPLPTASCHRLLRSGHSAVRLQDSLIVEEAIWSTERKARLRLVAAGLITGQGCANPEAFDLTARDGARRPG